VRSSAATAAWTTALAAAVLWPGHVLSPLDGMPLNSHADAVVIGVVLPALWWIDRAFLRRAAARVPIAALLTLKIASSLLLPQHGLCARFSTAPLTGVISTIQVDEPAGVLRSWDVRADARGAQPRCTAILDRAYASRDEFPSWFLNLLNGVRGRINDVTLDVDGTMTVPSAGTFTLAATNDMRVTGTVGSASIVVEPGRSADVPLSGGSHSVHLHASVTGDDWRLAPLWNGGDAWTAARFTAAPSGRLDAMVAPAIAVATPALVLLIVLLWASSSVVERHVTMSTIAWAVAVSAAFVLLALDGRFDRYAPVLLLGSVIVPLARRDRNLRSAFVLVGVPWLALFVARGWSQVGRVTIYSLGDDWQMYQAAAYRIFLNGYWIQGGSPTFYFQPFYRWIAGALHVLFGDASVGETYWDAACLLAAALTCFAVVKRVSGYRWAIGAAALTLATFSMAPTWYLIGRGLSEISGLGWMVAATLLLMHARRGRLRTALAAAVFAVLMFFTRLNHLLLTGFLLAWLLPIRTAARWRDLAAAVRRVRLKPAAVYAAAVAIGVVLFATHTWWYAGHFSIVYGTAFGPQQTGLTLATIGSPAVWTRIAEAFAAQLSMREPPAADLRATLVAVGAVLSVLAVTQVPYARRLPAPLAIVTVGTIAGSFFAHTHDYPGRMSVHVVPFAVAMSVCAASRIVRALSARRLPEFARTARLVKA
jgi:hypothetical protein